MAHFKLYWKYRIKICKSYPAFPLWQAKTELHFQPFGHVPGIWHDRARTSKPTPVSIREKNMKKWIDIKIMKWWEKITCVISMTLASNVNGCMVNKAQQCFHETSWSCGWRWLSSSLMVGRVCLSSDLPNSFHLIKTQ